ncbi:hypothetical protein Tco_0293763, partial [Tanacetum coccineum]
NTPWISLFRCDPIWGCYNQGRKSQDDPLVSLVQGLVTPSKTTVNASGEEQVEDISPTTLEAAKTLSRVASQKPKSIDKEKKAKNILLMATPKEHMRRFHVMDDAKEIWEAIRTRFGGNANSKKMKKAIFKQQFEAFKISSSEGLEKGYDRFQQLLSQLEAHGACNIPYSQVIFNTI